MHSESGSSALSGSVDGASASEVEESRDMEQGLTGPDVLAKTTEDGHSVNTWSLVSSVNTWSLGKAAVHAPLDQHLQLSGPAAPRHRT